MKIDVVITYHPKDRDLLLGCLQGIRRHVHFARVLVVCRRECKAEVESAGAYFVDEDSVVDGLSYGSFSGDRWGWYFQQILKLGIADRVDTDYYLVVDADTVFLRDVSFLNSRGKPLYVTGNEYHQPYFDVFEQLLGFSANREYSFIAHQMIYNRSIVREMRCRFRDCSPWYMNIVRYVEPQSPWFSISQFSEQETYGHYLKACHPDEVNIRPLKWGNIPFLPTKNLRFLLARYYDYCSFHLYNRRKPGPFLSPAWLSYNLGVGRILLGLELRKLHLISRWGDPACI
ncbi:MAG: hypothetical protein HY695_15975 [Deltaproteobacteria bacterium]|nr:hypothetical protein [Deltaproteobacteria bacterium]